MYATNIVFILIKYKKSHYISSIYLYISSRVISYLYTKVFFRFSKKYNI